jgi:2-phosphosulfolactate phosphatase
VAASQFRGTIALVVDQLRASITMTAALAAGAPAVVPVLDVETARSRAAQLEAVGTTTMLGGERGGVLIPGFDLANSPGAYTPDVVAGRVVVFTTTNGTASLLHASSADLVIVASLANCAAVAAAVVADPRPVHVLCAGGRGEVSADDVLAAGAIVSALMAGGRNHVRDDSARIAVALWEAALASGTPDEPLAGVHAAMTASCGGRSLTQLGLATDIDWCTRLNTLPVVPRFDPATGQITVA